MLAGKVIALTVRGFPMFAALAAICLFPMYLK